MLGCDLILKVCVNKLEKFPFLKGLYKTQDTELGNFSKAVVYLQCTSTVSAIGSIFCNKDKPTRIRYSAVGNYFCEKNSK